MLKGFDIAGPNGPNAAATVLTSRPDFLMVKATEGLSWNDPLHAATVASARRAGVRVGHYHYAWPEHDPIAEAKHFLLVAKPKPGDVLALDLERSAGGASWARRAAYAVAFLSYVRQASKASPLIYLNGDWIDNLHATATRAQWASITAAPLWYAHPNGQPGNMDARAHLWPVWTMHQYGSAPFDEDVLNGDHRVWDALAVPASASSSVGKVIGGVAVGVVLGAGGVVVAHPAPPASAVPHLPPVVKTVCPPAKPVVKPKPAPRPAPTVAAVFYTVRSGDTLGSIAARYHTTVAALARVNHISNVNVIRAGQRLRVK